MRRPFPPEDPALEELRRLKKRPRPPSGSKKRARWVRYAALVLLALACVGGAELAACRQFETEDRKSVV